STNKDLPLKLLCKLLFKEMEYNTYFEVKLRTLSYVESVKIHDISDIDVLGVNFLADMSQHLIGSECKSGESSALDELYKFIGVMDYYKIQKGYLIKSKIHQNARQVSISNNISCFTEPEIRALLHGLEIDIDKCVKIENAKYNKLTSAIKVAQKTNQKLVSYIEYDYWNKDNWRNIHNIIYLLSTGFQKSLIEDKSIEQKLFYYYVVELFAMALLKNISLSIAQNYSDVEHALRSFLYGGPEALHEKRKLYDLVGQYTNQNESFSPSWESDFINLSSRFSLNTKSCSRVVNLLQDVRENSFYSQKIEISKTTIGNYSDLTRKFTQDIIHFLIKNTSIEEPIFEEFMKI
ncbi:MAG: hypothetical protein PHI97_33690, partial [Desulfobulbus sp.]|nr:hypothetical protein [Desulfobulbus sp.]